MYVCMYVCMYVYIYVCIIYMYVYIYTCKWQFYGFHVPTNMGFRIRLNQKGAGAVPSRAHAGCRGGRWLDLVETNMAGLYLCLAEKSWDITRIYIYMQRERELL